MRGLAARAAARTGAGLRHPDAPPLRALLSERVATHYHDFLRANLGGQLVGENVHEFMELLPELPADTAAWVMGEIQ